MQSISTDKQISPHVVMDKVQALQKADLEGCKNKHPYCKDSLDLFKARLPDVAFIHFGDKPDDVEHLPFFSKMRDIGKRRGILWPLNVQRHFGTMAQVDSDDIVWEAKRAKIVWRGRHWIRWRAEAWSSKCLPILARKLTSHLGPYC